MSKPIRVITTKAVAGWPKGTDGLGFDNTAAADKVLGEGNYKVVAHQDGSPYEPPKQPRFDAKDEKKS